MSKFKVGDSVRVLFVPDWLLNELPISEQEDIRSYVGRQATVMEVDAYGYAWVGFGLSEMSEGECRYSGHSFALTDDCLLALS